MKKSPSNSVESGRTEEEPGTVKLVAFGRKTRSSFRLPRQSSRKKKFELDAGNTRSALLVVFVVVKRAGKKKRRAHAKKTRRWTPLQLTRLQLSIGFPSDISQAVISLPDKVTGLRGSCPGVADLCCIPESREEAELMFAHEAEISIATHLHIQKGRKIRACTLPRRGKNR